MMRIGSEALAEVEAALKAYEQAVEEAPLAPSSKEDIREPCPVICALAQGLF